MFASELDFVLANILMALLADFCLVWLPAPTVSYTCVSFCALTANCEACRNFSSVLIRHMLLITPESTTQRA